MANIQTIGNTANTIQSVDKTPVNKKVDAYRKTESAARPSQTDLTLSPQAQTLSTVQKKIAETPEIDEQKVADIRKQLDEGTYVINPDEITRKLLNMEKVMQDILT